MDLKRLADTPLSLKDLLDKCKEDVALALLLWKDFKSQPPDGDWAYASLMAAKMAEALGVTKELQDLTTKLPPLTIRPRTNE